MHISFVFSSFRSFQNAFRGIWSIVVLTWSGVHKLKVRGKIKMFCITKSFGLKQNYTKVEEPNVQKCQNVKIVHYPDGHHSGIHVSEKENRGGEFYSGASDL